ncbi:hypothetical protein BJY21_000914 [Kineosphaera limosa]|uniref:ESX secretion-associated protein EspG n=1 Tax=Kineosphaera limosa NBRC 100340 TaxID=1184609 RepID=K6XAK7_9MICO|nr:hypothetical protein [Kineosphaera limosa]NYD99729.1 hypothetical protein [Kineosphaera limosa]GAB95829.1 hypothetical protein KILIM_027_00120 [Kineosphaera limosa NBRC 100340]
MTAPNVDPVSLGGLEDLGALRHQTPRRRTGPAVAAQLVDLLCGAPASGAASEPKQHASEQLWDAAATGDLRDQRESLVRAGWFSPQGQPTLQTVRLRRDLGSTPALLELRVSSPDGRRRGWIRAGVALALVVVEEHPVPLSADVEAEPPGPVTFEVLPVGALPIALARWGGLAPTWNYDEVHDLGDAAAVQAVEVKVTDTSTPAPAGADEGLLDLWSREWSRWSVRGPHLGPGLEYVSIADAGQYVVRRRSNGGTVLAPRPGSLVWGDLQKLVAGLPGQGDPEEDDAADW